MQNVAKLCESAEHKKAANNAAFLKNHNLLSKKYR